MAVCYVPPVFFPMDRACAWVLGWARALARCPSLGFCSPVVSWWAPSVPGSFVSRPLPPRARALGIGSISRSAILLHSLALLARTPSWPPLRGRHFTGREVNAVITLGAPLRSGRGFTTPFSTGNPQLHHRIWAIFWGLMPPIPPSIVSYYTKV